MGQRPGMSPDEVRSAQWISARQANKAGLSFSSLNARVERVRPIRSGGRFGPGDDFLDVGSCYLELPRRNAHGGTDRLRNPPPEVHPVSRLADLPGRVLDLPVARPCKMGRQEVFHDGLGPQLAR